MIVNASHRFSRYFSYIVAVSFLLVEDTSNLPLPKKNLKKFEDSKGRKSTFRHHHGKKDQQC
jgi:hypothetical protein